ncbi:MAG: S-methyl-5-thioribose-1-phosphate isomerase [Firmicutes bacterium]|nr:S-methyl-5-thioribose-1-phosphate isomerase [Bacillota bacterium]
MADIGTVRPLWWEDDAICIVDQRLLPEHYRVRRLGDVESVREAIATLAVRGAPAIGIAGAFGVYLGMRSLEGDDWDRRLGEVAEFLASARPTAVNLSWAVNRVVEVGRRTRNTQALLDAALTIWEEDRRLCHRIGEFGAPLLEACTAVLTHCNAGALGTSEWGTALAPIYALQSRGKILHVYADETRPLWQGARLTAWELSQAGIPVTVIPDSAAAVVLRQGRVQAVVVGADRIASNGDTANKIGTYGLAVLARHHHIPFYVAAPFSTFDLSLSCGAEIPIEERSPEELVFAGGRRIVPEGAAVWNPAFDVTPAEYITAFITDRGVIPPPYPEQIAKRIRPEI